MQRARMDKAVKGEPKVVLDLLRDDVMLVTIARNPTAVQFLGGWKRNVPVMLISEIGGAWSSSEDVRCN